MEKKVYLEQLSGRDLYVVEERDLRPNLLPSANRGIPDSLPVLAGLLVHLLSLAEFRAELFEGQEKGGALSLQVPLLFLSLVEYKLSTKTE
jgi:hypothetical protein